MAYALDLMKEMAEALEDSEMFIGNGDCPLKATPAFLALKKFKEWKFNLIYFKCPKCGYELGAEGALRFGS